MEKFRLESAGGSERSATYLCVHTVALDELVHAAPQFGQAQIPDVLDQSLDLVRSRNVLRRTADQMRLLV